MAINTFILSFLIFLPFKSDLSNAQNWIKVGYWYNGSEYPIPDINSALFTHLICAFASISPTTYRLQISPSNEQYISAFTDTVKEKNPSIKTLLSIGGLAQTYPILSLMASNSSLRKSFIDSSIETARRYGFSGLDIFWIPRNNNSDMTNMGLLFDQWRAAVDSEPIHSNESRLMLTMIVHYAPDLNSVSYPIESIRRNMDWVHVLAFDYYTPLNTNFLKPHSALYDPSSHVSTDFGIGEWVRKGLPANKMVLGLAFHGYAWTMLNNQDQIGAPAAGRALTEDGSVSYRYIKSYIRSYGAGTVHNATYVISYCTIKSSWIGFDDVEDIKAKVSYAKEKGLLGYFVWQVPNDDNWVLSEAAQGGDNNQQKSPLVLIITLPLAGLSFSVVVSVTWYLRRRSLKSKALREKMNNNPPALQVFTYAEIRAATHDFSVENKLGEGGFGPVYKGELLDGQEVAVKRLSNTSNQGLEEFKNEVSLTATLQHVNLAKVIGFCKEREEKMLVYEYMPNKSLDSYLFDPCRRLLLDWKKRVCIINGITQGLLYLQEYSRFTIIHRDLKASNILLDSEMKPKISDFGIARIFEKDEQEANTEHIVGTYGYVPPEYVRKGIYSMKSDVYSFGVLLLQIISGKKSKYLYGLDENLNLLEYAYELWKDGKGMDFIDPFLDDSTSSCKLSRCLQVALLCVQDTPTDRPTMLEVFSMLNNESAVMNVPKRPAFSTKRDGDQVNRTGSSSTSVNYASTSEIIAR